MVIELKNISFSYKKGIEVLSNLSLSLKGGNCYVLKGANGSGKTTLAKLVMGLLKPTNGQVLIDSVDIKGKSVGYISQKIGYTFQNPDFQLFANTVLEELTFPYQFIENTSIDNDKINEVLEKFSLTNLKNRLPLTLSVGEKVRLCLASVYLRNVEFLILDEPSASLDLEFRQFLAEFIVESTQKGLGVLLITHDNEFESLISNKKLLTLKDGAIIES